jgi:phenylacetate-CoA ligase
MMHHSETEYFDELEMMTSETRERYQQQNLVLAIKRAYEKSISAREILNKAGIKLQDIQGIKDLGKIPITRKNDLIELEKKYLFGGFLTIPIEEVERIFISPGPVYEPLHSESIKWFAKTFWAAGFRKGDVVVNTFSYHMSPAGILFHEAIRDCSATALAFGTGNTEILTRTLIDINATGFVGTPSYLLSTIKKAEELGHIWNKEFNIKRAWFTGEMLTPAIRQTLENEYKVDTYQAYAVSEPGGAIAYECLEKNGLHFMDEYVIEIVEPATGKQLGPGEVGEVVVTPIHNSTWGIIRFGTGDLSSYTTEVCHCGRTTNRLTGILGRLGDSIKVRGLFVVSKQADTVFASFKEISRAQIVVDRPSQRDEMTFKIELKDEDIDNAALSEKIVERFQSACVLRPDRIEFVPSGFFTEKTKLICDNRKWQ